MTTLKRQLHNNLVALISLLVALSALGYSAWRTEVTEDNRSLHEAAFAMLKTAEELQCVVDFAHYDGNLDAGNPIKGWGKVLYLRDLGIVMPAPVATRAGVAGRMSARLGGDAARPRGDPAHHRRDRSAARRGAGADHPSQAAGPPAPAWPSASPMRSAARRSAAAQPGW